MVCERWWLTKMLCDKVVAEAGGGRRRLDAGGGEPGIQNRKQEPHTKMWGKTSLLTFDVLIMDDLWWLTSIDG
jgi:hypothetical protein